MRILGLSGVIALGVIFTGLYLSALAWVGTSALRPEDGGSDDEERSNENWRSLWRGARDRFAAQPVPVIVCVLLVWAWLLLARGPSLGLFGFGLVPALLAFWLNRIASAVDPDR